MALSTFTSIYILLSLAAFIMLGLFVLTLRQKRTVDPFGLMMLTAAIWSFTYMMELRSPTLDGKIMWAMFEYIGIATVPTFWLIFSIHYTGHNHWLSQHNLVLLFIIPVMTIVFVWTNSLHGYFWTEIGLLTEGDITILANSYGVLFWIHAAYSYVQLLGGAIVLIVNMVNFPERFRGKIFILLLAIAFPWISNIIFLTGIIPLVDMTPLAFTATGTLLGWAILRGSLFDRPVAYRLAVASMSDGMMMLDSNHRLLEYNAAMEELTRTTLKPLIGQTVGALFNKPLPLNNQQAVLNISIESDENVEQHLQLQISPIATQQVQSMGHVIIVRDVTVRQKAENETRTMLELIENIKNEWETTVDSLEQLICLLDKECIVIRTNLAVETWGLEKLRSAKGQPLTTLLGQVFQNLADELGNRWSEIVTRLEQGAGYHLQVHDAISDQYFEMRFEPIPTNDTVREAGSSFAVLSIYNVTERKYLERALDEALDELGFEYGKSENLLHNILPTPIAQRLKSGEEIIADDVDDVTVLFADIVGFTKLASSISATELVSKLNEIFSAFDILCYQYGLEKIKTLGDAYMVVGGLPLPNPDHAKNIAKMALDMQRLIKQFANNYEEALTIRIGIHSGSVVAGVIGTQKLAYDLWGDTVNIASRMESHGVAGRIQVSEATFALLYNDFIFEERGEIDLKNRGTVRTYFLEEEVPEVLGAD